MANYIEIKNHLKDIALDVDSELISSDGFEVLKQSHEFDNDEIVILNDVSDLKSNNKFTNGGFITNDYAFVLWFVKHAPKDSTQDELDPIYSELKTKSDEFFYTANTEATIEIPEWKDERGIITDNYFLAVKVTFNLGTACNLS